MAYIFMDESGDLGFNFSKKKTTQWFLVTFLFCNEKRPIEKLVSRIHAGLKKIHKRKSGVLHCHNESPTTRFRLLRELANKNCRIIVIYLNKKKVYTKLQEEKNVLYNYVTNILLNRIYENKLVPLDNLILIASRKETNRFLNENFKSYLADKIKTNHKHKLQVVIKTPHEEKSLQATDFVSWSIFRKYEYGDSSYYDVIKSLIIGESSLFA